jgi:hypothetical protein
LAKEEILAAVGSARRNGRSRVILRQLLIFTAAEKVSKINFSVNRNLIMRL